MNVSHALTPVPNFTSVIIPLAVTYVTVQKGTLVIAINAKMLTNVEAI